MLHSALWKDKDLCNLPELSHPLKACQPAFCRLQEVVIPSSISLCWASESVILSAPLCACWYVLAYGVRLCFGPVFYWSHHRRNVQLLHCTVHRRKQISAARQKIPQSWIIKLGSERRCLFCCTVLDMFIIRCAFAISEINNRFIFQLLKNVRLENWPQSCLPFL